ncbi:acyltransferase family protein [Nocardioides hankookensis]|uniref:Acyltransferase family protein n=1 Tax=Nocardioides hankookensis TaxID=443157 RepID=A0ABW1LP34_9ACTN
MTLPAPTETPRANAGRPVARFRGDIQGMRAVAVLLVIAAHAGFSSLSGGYIGVDVFFVVSGFLITTLLMREVVRSERLSLLGFYARRARRILPAATVVLVATCLASAVFLPVVRADEIFVDAIWAGLFASNIRFAMVETDYFATDRPVSPLQHFWSLSVEEQFYVIWPLLLLLVLATGHLVARRYDVRRRATVVLAVLVAASLGWSVWATYASPDTAYFSTLTRAWELGAGALLAVVMLRRDTADEDPPPRTPGIRVELLAAAGIVAILVGAVTFDAQSPFPGVLAAVPVLGAVAVLAAGGLAGGERTLVARALSVRPARIVGDWSYSLYLWHFPVLVIARSHWHGLSRTHLVVCLVAIFVLSGLTYRFVEEPFRRGRVWRPSWRAVALYPASVGIVVLGLVVSNAWIDHKLDRNAGNPAISVDEFAGKKLSDDPARALVQASVLAAKKGQPVPGDLVPGLRGIRQDTAPLGDCDYRTGTHQLCPNGDPDADRSIVVIGDSHARAWSPAVNAIGAKHGYRAYTFVYSGCPANQAYRLDPETGRRWAACEDFINWTIDTIGDLRPDLVLISNAPLAPVVDPETGDVVERAGNREEFTRAVGEGLRREIEALTPYAGEVAVLGNTPKLPREQAVCLSEADDLGDCLFSPSSAQRSIERSFGPVAAEAGARYVDAEHWFCDRRRCPSVVGSFIPMRDSEHMTTEYAEHLAEPLAAVLGISDASATPSSGR